MKRNVTVKIKPVLELAMKYKYAALILLFGLVLMLLPSGGTKKETPQPKSENQSSAFDLQAEEKRLEELFTSIDGVGRVKVALTLKSGAESVYALDKSESLRDGGGGAGTSYEKDSDSRPMVLSSDSGGEVPLTIKEYYPEFRGALVVCDGADNPNIMLAITEAIRSLTGITSDNITVIKMKN